MTDPDAVLVARIRSGDAAAFEALMRRYFRMAFLIAYARLQNREDAEDVCQDAFVRCWERIGDCRDPERVSSWIATIVRNTAHNRRDFLRLRDTEPLENAAAVSARGRSDAATDRNELRARLGAALGALTPVQREIVLLHDLEGWRHAEIASRLGLSELMSRRHLSDARKRLRRLLVDLPTMETDHD
jgi:RNA polymerase sigma-70 factor (ECF subfamily)